ncbi:MAG: ribonuclease III [Flavobacteriales bacterium]|nr:ribonuclease III [Flavobacteriales bacterium]
MRKILGFRPGNPELYARAFLHSSFANNTREHYKNHNERLEFLGDLILDAAVGTFLYEKYPHLDEGELTRRKMKFVNRATLNKLAYRMNLQDLIIGNFSYQKMPEDVAGNCLEALIGAVYLDKGFDFTCKIILKRFFDKHLNIINLLNTEDDFKSKLMLWAQKNKKKVEYKMAGDSRSRRSGECLVEIWVESELMGKGAGRTRKQAEQDAARAACEQLHL